MILEEVDDLLTVAVVLRMLEHVRSRHPRWARWQDRLQPMWTRATGGCRPNRDTEQAVEAAGFRVDAATRRARGNMRRLVGRASSALDAVAGAGPAG